MNNVRLACSAPRDLPHPSDNPHSHEVVKPPCFPSRRIIHAQVVPICNSGHAPTASSPAALPMLRTLIRTASRMPSAARILVGSGINARTIGPLLRELLPCGLREVHLSGGGWVPSEMEFRREGLGMGVGGEGEWGIWRTDEEKIREVTRLVDEAWKEFVERERQRTE